MWVMQKDNILPAPQKGYKSKDGLHLQFPNIIKIQVVICNITHKDLNTNIYLSYGSVLSSLYEPNAYCQTLNNLLIDHLNKLLI